MDKKLLTELEDTLAKAIAARHIYEQFNVIDNPETKAMAMKSFEMTQQEVSDAAEVLLTKICEEKLQTPMDKIVRWLKTH